MFREIAIGDLRPSALNYRRTFDKTRMEELTASVRAKGVLQPILVRPLVGDNDRGSFEIVAGHRRFTAATAAGLMEIPAVVRALSDEEALEAQVIENSQREDPNPMDEGRGFKRLMEMGRHTPETIAAKIYHSIPYVLGRLKLVDLPEEAQEKIATGEISLGHALLLTRLGNEGEQMELLRMITEDDGITVTAAREYLSRRRPALIEAPFDLAGCEMCQHRSRNQADLFPELMEADDECMDKSCYFSRSMEHYQAIVDEKSMQGFRVITDPDEGEKVTAYGAKRSHCIGAGGTKQDWKVERPRRYKSECMKCSEHHAWYLYVETSRWSCDEIKFGEVCLNRSCLAKMNKLYVAKGSGDVEAKEGEGTEGAESHADPVKARMCRDRFLKRVMPAGVETSAVVQKRLLIYTLLTQYSLLADDEFLSQTFPEYGDAPRWWPKEEIYRCVLMCPLERLEEALLKTLLASLEETEPTVLLMAAPEAGVDVMSELAVDEEFLRGKTKAGLRELIRELWPEDDRTLILEECLSGETKKGAIINNIMAMDLVGKIPREIAEVCE